MSNRARPAARANAPAGPDARLGAQGRVLGYGAALVAAGSFLVLWVPNMDRHAPGGGTSGATYLVVGLTLAVLLAFATLTGRRLAVGVAALLVAAGPWGPERLFQLLYFLLAVALIGWVLYAAKVHTAKASRPSPGARSRPKAKIHPPASTPKGA